MNVEMGVHMEIQVLDEQTIDKIAAGEVVEKPSSVVKELVENAIDSGATMITVEIKDGGCSLIRVTDNGCGMEKSQVPTAFLRHATSKIRSIEDLIGISSLGFRGEALSSIAAVGQVELITKTKDDITGLRYVIEGSKEKKLEEIGAPDGTTFIVRNLFFNTPARRKFLKSPATEGSYITDLMEHIMLSNPQISFTYILNNHTKLQSSGTGDMKEVIYKIYGRDITNVLIPIDFSEGDMRISGFLAEPIVARSNRSFECYFVNGRYVKSSVVSKALEEAYQPYLMQHKYPFTVLQLSFGGNMLDVNVHPTKMEVRFSDNPVVYDFIRKSAAKALKREEFIPEVRLSEDEEQKEASEKEKQPEKAPEPFEANRILQETPVYQTTKQAAPCTTQTIKETEEIFDFSDTKAAVKHETDCPVQEPAVMPQNSASIQTAPVVTTASEVTASAKPEQMNLFEEHLLTKKARDEYEIIGQVFDTYWIIAYHDRMLLIDQHAAHEKVLFERFMKQMEHKEMTSQQLNPPLVLSVSGKEEEVLKKYEDSFAELGFEIEHFGGNEYTVHAIPDNLYGLNAKDLFLEMLDDLSDGLGKEKTIESIHNKIATMSCKAAVKGNNRLSRKETEVLLDELLELDNPYNCPHGRPTIITMTKQELEKKFKRIV